MRAWRPLLLALAVGIGAPVAIAPPAKAVCVSPHNGLWSGTYSSSRRAYSNNFTANITSNDAGGVSGVIAVGGSPALTNAVVTGTISCDKLRLVSGTLVITATLSSATALSGTYEIVGVDSGTLSANAQPTPLRFLAMGDSYSAGVGVGAVAPGCDRDRLAYGPRANSDLLPGSHTVVSFSHVACSGYKIAELRRSQLPVISGFTNVVSLTIGGNDIGFSGKVAGCLIQVNCPNDVMSLLADSDGVAKSWDTVFNDLVSLYVDIRHQMASNGHLYVLTYPIPFARTSSASCATFSATEQNAANALVTRLDDTIYWAIARANSDLSQRYFTPGNVHFVDWRTGTRVSRGYTIPMGKPNAGARFDTYTSNDGLCGPGNPFLNGFVGAITVPLRLPRESLRDFATRFLGNSFHPKTNGYYKAAELLTATIRAFQP